MTTRLNIKNENFEADFKTFLGTKREASIDVSATVFDILKNVRERGNDALYEYTEKFDQYDLNLDNLRVSEDEINEAARQVDEKNIEALRLAHYRIYEYHARLLPQDDYYTDSIGVELGLKWSPIEAVGLYVPGGTASYPSSVLMNAVPAKAAGVERIVMVVPTQSGYIAPSVLAAASLVGIDEVYRIGGAQAIGALAYGTQTIDPVCKIVGPGNAYVAEAKRQVFGTVGIDMIAGPSEVLVIADAKNDPDWVAADLLAQAEHDASAQSILITDDEEFSKRVEEAVEAQLKTLPRCEIATKSWRDFGAIIVVDDLEQAPELSNKIAPEHLEIMTDNPEKLLEEVRNAGAVFLGRYTPEAIGDYVGGTNHVLPTSRSARFSSGLSVLEYIKRTSILKCGSEQLKQSGQRLKYLPMKKDLKRIENLCQFAGIWGRSSIIE